jgi:hypothetical protein
MRVQTAESLSAEQKKRIGPISCHPPSGPLRFDYSGVTLVQHALDIARTLM